MNKILVVLMVLVLSLSAIAGCGEPTEEPTAPEPTVSAPVQQPPVTVTLAIGKTPNQFLISMSLGVAVSGTTAMTILAVIERRRRNARERVKEVELDTYFSSNRPLLHVRSAYWRYPWWTALPATACTSPQAALT